MQNTATNADCCAYIESVAHVNTNGNITGPHVLICAKKLTPRTERVQGEKGLCAIHCYERIIHYFKEMKIRVIKTLVSEGKYN